ncbi:hypothetical protein D915_000356 [Fasciola hepatica]|uniref:RRM domain-containing protein n=1 Tax=Fasciola hepatica TaxID=6192 RepID=A0A4E0RMI8_FASHE|nr:hypothetical protein D915_000356 [Fasciola hepatica]
MTLMEPESPNSGQSWTTVDQDQGFVAATLKSYGKNGKSAAPVGFVSFQTREQAEQALHQLKGLRMDPSNSLQLRVEFAHTNTRLTQDLSNSEKFGCYLQSGTMNGGHPGPLPVLPATLHVTEDSSIPKAPNMPVFLLPTPPTSFFPFAMIPPPPTPPALPTPVPSYFSRQPALETSSWPTFSPLVDRQTAAVNTELTPICIPLLSPDTKQTISSCTVDLSSNPCSPSCSVDTLSLWNTTDTGPRRVEGAAGNQFLPDQDDYITATSMAGSSPGLHILPWPLLQTTGGNWFIPRGLPPSVPEVDKLISNGFPFFMMTAMGNSRASVHEVPIEFDIFGQPVISGPQEQRAGEELPKLDGSLGLNSYFHIPDREIMPGWNSDTMINYKTSPKMDEEACATGFSYTPTFVQP